MNAKSDLECFENACEPDVSVAVVPLLPLTSDLSLLCYFYFKEFDLYVKSVFVYRLSIGDIAQIFDELRVASAVARLRAKLF